MITKMRKIWIPLALLFSIIFLSVGFAVIQSRTKQVSAEGKGEIFYYVSAGNLVAGADGTGENVDRSGTIGYPNKQQTDFMALYGLEFGDETGVGLYNSVTDKLYGEDTVTGKNWGLKEYSSWNDWRCGLTGSSDSQYLTYRQINESSGEGVMTYIFEVDDTETELSVQFGTLTPYGWGEKSYNFRLNGGKEEEITSTNVGEVHSYTASGVTAEDGKNYITLEFGTDDRNAYVSWIMIATTDYELPEPGFVNYSFPYYIKKGDTTIQAFHPDDGEDVTAELSETAQTVVDSADTFDNVSVAVTINEHEYTVNLIVLPQSTEYFVDVGTTHGDGQYGLPDAPYISEKGYGYLVKQGEAWGTQFDANSFEDSSVYGANKDSFVYRFDVPAGTYAVEVGTYGHWNMGRKMNVNVNGGDIVVLEAVANTATSLTYYAASVEDEGKNKLELEVAYGSDNYDVSYVLVYEVYSLNYNSCGGTSVETEYFEPGTEVAISSVVPERVGYDFVGWFTLQDGGEQVTDNIRETTTLYAHWKAKQYKVTLTTDEEIAALPDSLTFTYNEEITGLPEAPEKTGYSFGWFTAGTGGNKIVNGEVWRQEVTQLFGRYVPNTYNVMLDAGEGSLPEGAQTTLTAIYDSVLILPVPIAEEGYRFAGWFTAETGGKLVKSGAVWNKTEDITLYARYSSAQAVEVTLHSDGGSSEEEIPGTIMVTQGEAVDLPVLSKTGHTFAGWYTAQTGGILYESGDIWNEELSAKDLYARFIPNTYKVVYAVNGGQTLADGSYTYGIGLTELPVPERTGYTFAGWFLDDTLTGDAVVSIAADKTEDITLYAKWSANTYKVVYAVNGGQTLADGSYTYGIGLTELPVPERTGYTFEGWYVDEALTGDTITLISASDIGDKILYAKWTANMYTVTFETNGGSAIGDILYTYGIGFDELPIPVRDGYTFIGWYINGDLTGETMVSIAADDTGDFTLYAGWALKTYTVNFETNGGGSVGAITINHGETLTKPSDPERDGYVFMGWYSDPACTQLYDFDRATSGNITLYAGWEKEETTGCGSVIVSGSIAVFGGSFIFVTLLFVINKKRTINQ